MTIVNSFLRNFPDLKRILIEKEPMIDEGAEGESRECRNTFFSLCLVVSVRSARLWTDEARPSQREGWRPFPPTGTGGWHGFSFLRQDITESRIFRKLTNLLAFFLCFP